MGCEDDNLLHQEDKGLKGVHQQASNRNTYCIDVLCKERAFLPYEFLSAFPNHSTVSPTKKLEVYQARGTRQIVQQLRISNMILHIGLQFTLTLPNEGFSTIKVLDVNIKQNKQLFVIEMLQYPFQNFVREM